MNPFLFCPPRWWEYPVMFVSLAHFTWVVAPREDRGGK